MERTIQPNLIQPLTVGARVSFDTGRGTQNGHIIDLLSCIGNGRQHALIEIDHALPGMTETVPVDELTIERRHWRAQTHSTGA